MKVNKASLIEVILGVGLWLVFALYTAFGKQLPPYID